MTGITIVSKLLRGGNRDIKEMFELLLKGDSIEVRIEEHIVYDQLESDEAAVWSLLLASGYLKELARKREIEFEDGVKSTYGLVITNFETRQMFEGVA